jgi:hypothetical protein
MKLRILASTTFALGLALAAAPASAIDPLTGTYEGKFSCKGSNAGTPTKAKGDATVLVSDGENVLMRVSENGTPVGGDFILLHIEETVKQDRSKVAGADCGLLNVGRGVALEADAVIKSGSEKGTLKGIYIRMGEKPSRIDVCTFTVKRTATTDPEVAGCPA